MSISLKIQHANEIAESMSETLKSKEFSGLFKSAQEIEGVQEASDPPELPPRKPVVPKTAPSMQTLYNVAVKHLGFVGTLKDFEADSEAQRRARVWLAKNEQNASDINTSATGAARKAEIEKMKAKLEEAKKYQLEQAKKSFEDVLKQIDQQKTVDLSSFLGKESKADDVVLAWTIKNLTKVANALDVNGYTGVANVIDGTINKLAKKQSFLKAAFEMGVESVEPDKKHLIEKAKSLIDEGNFSEAIELLSGMTGFVGDLSDLELDYSEEVSEEE